MAELKEFKEISYPPKVSFAEFKKTCHVAKYGNGYNSMYKVYYGAMGSEWKYIIYPWEYRRQGPGYEHNKAGALKQAYYIVFEMSADYRNQRQYIFEGAFKISISY